MTKPFQAGHGAEAGIVAADLAALGWTAAEDILEAKRGFFAAFGGGCDPGAIVGKLGKPWSLLSARRVDQALSVRLAHPPGDGRDGGADRASTASGRRTWPRSGSAPTGRC